MKRTAVLVVLAFAAGFVLRGVMGGGGGGETSRAEREREAVRAPETVAKTTTKTGTMDGQPGGDSGREPANKTGLRVPIRVLMPDGSEAPSATIRIFEDGDPRRTRPTRSRAWTPDRASIDVEPDDYVVWASRGPAQCSARAQIEIRSGRAPELVTLKLRERAVIRGQVRSGIGLLMQQIFVHALRYEGEVPAIGRLRRSRTAAVLGRDGSFRFEDLEPGRYLLGLLDSSVECLATTTVEARPGTVDAVLPLDLPREDYLVLHLFGPDGTRLRHFDLHTGFGGGMTGGVSLRRPDGSFAILHHRDGRIEDRTAAGYYVRIDTRRYGRKEIPYKWTPNAEATVRLKGSGRLVVSLGGYVEKEHRGPYSLVVFQKKGKERPEIPLLSPYHTEPERNGVFRFGPIETGTWIVALLVKSDELRALPAGSVELEIKTGDNRLQIPLPVLHPLRVRGTPGMDLMLRPVGGAEMELAQSRLDEEGNAVFRNLPQGTYEITCWTKDGEQAVRVRVPDQVEVDLRRR